MSERALKIAELCRLNYFYNRKSGKSSGKVVTGISALMTLVAAVVAPPVALFAGIPMIAAGVSMLNEKEDGIYVETIWNAFQTGEYVHNVGEGEFELTFSIDYDKSLHLYRYSHVPRDLEGVGDKLFFRTTFDSDKVISCLPLN